MGLPSVQLTGELRVFRQRGQGHRRRAALNVGRSKADPGIPAPVGDVPSAGGVITPRQRRLTSGNLSIDDFAKPEGLQKQGLPCGQVRTCLADAETGFNGKGLATLGKVGPSGCHARSSAFCIR